MVNGLANIREISDFFFVTSPHLNHEHKERDVNWAFMNKEYIHTELIKNGPPAWYQKIEVIKGSGIFTEPNSIDSSADLFFNNFGLTEADLKNKRVLDIGAFSGAISFIAEDWGAEVFSIDIQSPKTNGYSTVHNIRKSTATHITMSVYDLHPELLGSFDVVIFSGVHYHFKHPLLALERVNSVTKPGGLLLTLGTSADRWIHTPDSIGRGVDINSIEVCDKEKSIKLSEIPLISFYKNHYLNDTSNWFIPNTLALSHMIEASGFEVLSSASHPMDQLNITRSCSVIMGRKVGEPIEEYSSDVYHHLRKFKDDDKGSVSFKIPTFFELEKERRIR